MQHRFGYHPFAPFSLKTMRSLIAKTALLFTINIAQQIR